MLRALGAELVAWSEGAAVVEAQVAPPMLNRQNVAHGGALMTLMDAAMGYAGCYCPYPGRVRHAFTLSLTTNFIAAGRAATRLRTEARQIGGGRSVYFAQADIWDAEDRLVASATGAFKYRGESGALFGMPRAE